jgi:uncharacterized membrane protein YkvA (DUF1232 family)
VHRLTVLAALVVGLYLLVLLGLALTGRRAHARALVGFVPDCLVLFRRMLGDERVHRRRKLALVLVIGYLAMPIDLIPDFFPVVGQIDDAIVVAVALRYLLRSGGAELLREHWPGPKESLNIVLRLAYGTHHRESP